MLHVGGGKRFTGRNPAQKEIALVSNEVTVLGYGFAAAHQGGRGGNLGQQFLCWPLLPQTKEEAELSRSALLSNQYNKWLLDYSYWGSLCFCFGLRISSQAGSCCFSGKCCTHLNHFNLKSAVSAVYTMQMKLHHTNHHRMYWVDHFLVKIDIVDLSDRCMSNTFKYK
jgi:hypothetical protein